MTGRGKVMTYLVGFVLGCGVLMWLPRPEGKRDERVERWRGQTAPVGYYPLQHEDVYGREVLFERQPRWVVSLAPSVTEILFAMEMGDHLSGVTDFCRYPPAALSLPKVGRMDTPNMELLLAAHPQLVLGTALTPRNVFDRLGGQGIAAVALSHENLEGLFADIGTMGRLLGVPGHSLRLVTRLREELGALDEEVAVWRDGKKRRVLFIYGFDGLHSAGKGTWPGDLIERAGGVNLADEALSSWPSLNEEAVVAADPEVILVAWRDGRRDERFEAEVARWKTSAVWQGVSAVRENRVVALAKDPLAIPGPRVVEAYGLVARGIWGVAEGD